MTCTGIAQAWVCGGETLTVETGPCLEATPPLRAEARPGSTSLMA